MRISEGQSKAFSPVFVVGAPRSGTTMLAVLLNRHSLFAIPPETQFFSDFEKSEAGRGLEGASREVKVRMALSYHRIADLGLTSEMVMDKFAFQDNTVANLFRSILEAYGQRLGKERVGEKSPKHIENVLELLAIYPGAKVLCIVRDGRDVVRSLIKAPWAEPDNPRRFGLFCTVWSDYARLVGQYEKKISGERFKVVRYEEILQHTSEQLKAVCDFLGVAFEPGMLSATLTSGVVPDWEAQWKQKADQMLDPSRAYAWRTQADKREVWQMNVMIGPELDMLGYACTSIVDCPLWLRFVYRVQKVPYLPSMRQISLFGLRLARAVQSVFK